MSHISLVFVLLGIELLVAPFTFGYLSTPIGVSDMAGGLLILLLALLGRERKGALASIMVIGVWLPLAPLIFWARLPVVYYSDTAIGCACLVLAFLRLFPSQEVIAEECPSGWSFNPSSWTPRMVTVVLAAICFALSRYMAACQLGYIDHVYDPFFGEGTMQVITSPLAKDFPVSDAGLGAFGYLMECVLGALGSTRRWRTMPFLVFAFGLMVVPAGVISILLIFSQPIIVGAWCGNCLVIALCMLIMVVLAAPELVAVVQLLRQAKKEKWGMSRTFWRGVDPSVSFVQALPYQRKGLSSWGISFPWHYVALMFVGVALVFSSPLQLGPSANEPLGCLLITISILCFSQCLRFLRWGISLVIGGVLVYALPFPEWRVLAVIFAIIMGLGMIPEGKRRERIGGG